MSFLVESGKRWAELCAVHVSGRARLVSEPDLATRVAVALDAKYGPFRTARAAMPAATRAHYEVERATIEITPDDRVLGWDNARLGVR